VTELCQRQLAERVVPTATTEDVRPTELGRYRKSYELGGQARVIRKSMGIDSMVKNRGGEHLVLKPPIVH